MRMAQIVLAAAVIVAGPNAFAQSDHGDTILNYWACDGTNKGPAYTASWTGDNFHHVQSGGPDVHDDSVMNYITWDGTCWKARWDSSSKSFVHKRFPSGADEHGDTILNYLTWNDELWTATRDGNAWYHVYIAPPNPGSSKNIFDQVDHWLERNKKAVGIAIVIYEALDKLPKE